MGTKTHSGCPIPHRQDDATSEQTPTRNGTHKVEEIDFSKCEEIPEPPMKYYGGVLGHVPEVNLSFPLKSYWSLMDQHGPIFKLSLGTPDPRILVGNNALLSEMLDDDRFQKSPNRVQQAMRDFMGDGLFTAKLEEENWWKAHRILIPAFGPIGLKKMFEDMLEISTQLILKWDRFGPNNEIDSAEDFTRLTFDTIGLCGFGYRFNEFYSERAHPFAEQLQEALLESGKKGNRPPFMQPLYYKAENQRQENIAKMRELCDQVVQERIRNPQPDARDVLNLMLNGVDPESGEKLSVENVQFQMVTFLAGGFETTSGSLGFTYYFLCNHPDKLAKAQEEVDEVLGLGVVTFEMLPKFKYLDACIKESLRMMSPINMFNRTAKRDTTLGNGKYFIKKGQLVSGLLRHFHRDSSIWGDDADVFRPERFLDGGWEALPKNSWKAFGDGLRACIGSGFSIQEMLINMAMVLQRFDCKKADPDYELELKSTLSIKPKHFMMKVSRRPGRTMMTGLPGGEGWKPRTAGVGNGAVTAPTQHNNTGPMTTRMTALYGGNMGTSLSLVEEFAASAKGHGVQVDIQSLDAVTEQLQPNHSYLIVTASYDGRPPDNAKKFVSWMEKLLAAKNSRLPDGVKFAVFGVGNTDWFATLHRIPRMVDQALADLGGERIVEAAFADVKKDLLGPWDEWSEKLCSAITGKQQDPATSIPPPAVGINVDLTTVDENVVQHAAAELTGLSGTLLCNELLADGSVGTPKRHVEIQLPEGTDYCSGDYLAIHARNPVESVERVMRRFALTERHAMTVTGSDKVFMPSQPVLVKNFLETRVELAMPATKRQLAQLAAWATSEGCAADTYTFLVEAQEDNKYQTILEKRYSVIDVLDEVPQLRPPFGLYIDMLPRLAPRTYSIASSPRESAGRRDSGTTAVAKGRGPVAALTVDVFESPALSGHGTFRGVASNYLSLRKYGDVIDCVVQACTTNFRLPSTLETPLILLAAGTGIAPMRAFVQERAIAARKGEKLGPALFFFGCRHPDKDFLYRDEFERWQKEGIVEMNLSFSKPTINTDSTGSDGRHVPEALWELQDRVWSMIENDGARVFVCGSASKIGRSSASTFQRIWMSKTGGDAAEALVWLEKMKQDRRYLSDVY